MSIFKENIPQGDKNKAVSFDPNPKPRGYHITQKTLSTVGRNYTTDKIKGIKKITKKLSSQ